MAKYKQGGNDRLDESLGMRRGPERDMKQSYKARRDESRGMKSEARKKNDRYMPKGMKGKVMKDDRKPSKIDVPEGQGFKQVKPFHCGNKGYPRQAFDYKY